MENTLQWRDYPCPLHPSWGLGDISDLDHAKLKQSIDTDDNEEMVVERHIYRAFLEFPIQGGVLCQQKPCSPSKALDYLQKAEDCVEKLQCSENAAIGYGIVINTFRMWITTEPSEVKEFERKLNELSSKKNNSPDHEVYVEIVRAYILSRLGPRWSEQALSLYSKAVERFPKNCEWMLRKALIIWRNARYQMEIRDWKYPLPRPVIQQLQEEKTILEDILRLRHNCHHARALHGSVCFYLGTECHQVEKQMLKALKSSKDNPTICLVVAKFYTRSKQFLKAEKLLEGLLRTVGTAEVYCQLGCLYRAWATCESNAKECTQLRQKALHNFARAADLDSCHYPSLCKKAEMNYLLGFKKEAQKLFMDLFDITFKDKFHLVLEEYSCLKLAIWTDVFSPPQIIQLCSRFIELTVKLPDMSSFITEFNPDLVKKHIDRCLQKLRTMTYCKDKKIERDAKLKLAKACLSLKDNMEWTEQFHQDLIKESKNLKEKNELSFGLGKCCIIMGQQKLSRKDKKHVNTLCARASSVAAELHKSNLTHLANELYADIHLLKAKAVSNEAIEEKEYGDELKEAITMGSLEACHMYTSSMKYLKENFFIGENIPETLARVQHVCDNDSPLHTNFEMETSIFNVASKRQAIRNNVESIINWEINIEGNSEKVSSLVTQLKRIKQTRFEYEVELINSKRNHDWGEVYIEKLTNLLVVTRNTMDNCIAVCQKMLLELPPNDSMFKVCFDWKTGEVNPRKCQKEVETWAKDKIFPNISLPAGFLTSIIEIQPMYDENNLWLAALHRFVSIPKHKRADLLVGESFSLELEENSVPMKTEDIARRSSNEVVKLVKHLVQCSQSQANTNNTVRATETANLTEVTHAARDITNDDLSLTSSDKADTVTK